MTTFVCAVKPEHQQTFLDLLQHGFGPFTVEIVEVLAYRNTLTVTVRDDMALSAFLDRCESIHLITIIEVE